MAINKKLIHFKKGEDFDKALKNNEILDTSIVFIKDRQQIYTHGLYYNKNNLILSPYPENHQIYYRTIDSKKLEGELEDFDFSGYWYDYDWDLYKETNDELEEEIVYECINHEFYPELNLGVLTYNDRLKYCPNIFSNFDDVIIEVILPQYINYILEGTFNYCTNLETVKLHPENRLEGIGPEAFEFSGLKYIDNLKSLDLIRHEAFKRCNFKEISIPNCLRIAKDAFYNCESLNTVQLSTNINKLGDQCFAECSNLTSINSKNGELLIENCGKEVFFKCYSLSHLPKISGHIGHFMFKECQNLKDIILENIDYMDFKPFNDSFIEKIIVDNLYNNDEYCFTGSKNLKYLEIKNSYNHIGDIVINSDSLRIIDVDVYNIDFEIVIENLEKLILRYDEIVEGLEQLNEQPELLRSNLKIYVPSELLKDYKKYYPNIANRFYPIYGEITNDSSSSSCQADWDAKKDEPGYIKNKPFGLEISLDFTNLFYADNIINGLTRKTDEPGLEIYLNKFSSDNYFMYGFGDLINDFNDIDLWFSKEIVTNPQNKNIKITIGDKILFESIGYCTYLEIIDNHKELLKLVQTYPSELQPILLQGINQVDVLYYELAGKHNYPNSICFINHDYFDKLKEFTIKYLEFLSIYESLENSYEELAKFKINNVYPHANELGLLCIPYAENTWIGVLTHTNGMLYAELNTNEKITSFPLFSDSYAPLSYKIDVSGMEVAKKIDSKYLPLPEKHQINVKQEEDQIVIETSLEKLTKIFNSLKENLDLKIYITHTGLDENPINYILDNPDFLLDAKGNVIAFMYTKQVLITNLVIFQFSPEDAMFEIMPLFFKETPRIEIMTQQEYDNTLPKDPNTLYFIQES